MKKVVAAVFRQGSKVLIARRSAGSREAGKWEFPGGRVEPGEKPEESLRREILEEFGLETEVGSFLCSSRGNIGGEELELLAYEARFGKGEFKLNAHDEVRWVSLEESLSYDLAPLDPPVIEYLRMNWDDLP